MMQKFLGDQWPSENRITQKGGMVTGPSKRIFTKPAVTISAHWRPFHCFVRDSEETSARDESFAKQMKLESEIASEPEANSIDRRVIRIDAQPSHAGITAALRRAFDAAASEPCERDFAELLRRLN